MSKFAVFDLETTGLGNADRVVEIGVVVIDGATGTVVDEFDTLVNPQRDIGTTSIHGISASMVESAPTFDEVAGALARVLGGNTLVAHNLSFDQRFLLREFARAGVDVDPGIGICTYKLSRERLDVACQRFGVPLPDHHRALADARAAAGILGALAPEGTFAPVRFGTDIPPGVPRTLRRDSVGGAVLPISPSRFRVRYPTVDELAASYLHILDAYLDDLVLDAVERQGLDDLAALYGIDDERRAGLHNAYVAALVMAARRDGIVSEAEHELIESVCRALDASPDLIPEVTARPSVSALDGQRVCFTGTFVVAGIQMSKEQLAGIAANAGLQPVDDVRKAGCDLLVAADPASTSGKATKARQWGIPVIGISDFMALVDSANI